MKATVNLDQRIDPAAARRLHQILFGVSRSGEPASNEPEPEPDTDQPGAAEGRLRIVGGGDR